MLSATTGTRLQEEALAQLEKDLPQKGFSTLDNFIDAYKIENIHRRFEKLRVQDAFDKAGIGKGSDYGIDPGIRGDYICWIDQEDPHPSIVPIISTIRNLIPLFNRWFFLSLKDFEAHYTIYPPGKFYLRHKDQFDHNTHRHISFVLYLNEHWLPGDGGELVLFKQNACTIIAPVGGRLVIFRSEMEHEVLLTHKPRYSITGWMLDTPLALTFL